MFVFLQLSECGNLNFKIGDLRPVSACRWCMVWGQSLNLPELRGCISKVEIRVSVSQDDYGA